MSVKIGNARYSGESNKNYFKLKDGESVYRILPPLGDLADDGRWSVFYSIHYGYKNSEGKMRTFQSTEVKNRKSKMVEIPDAAKDRIAKGKAQLEAAKASGNKALEEQLFKLFGGQKPVYNLDSHHYMNVMDLQGNIGILKIRHKAKLALDAVIKQLRAEGKDPIGVNDGRFFIFSRSGKGTDTVYQVRVYKEKINVQGVGDVERDFVHTLTPEIIARLEKEAGQLDKLAVKPTAEEVQRIVTEGASAVDEILDGKYGRKNASSEEEAGDEDGEEVSVSNAPTQSASNVTQTAQATAQAQQTAVAAAAPSQATTQAAPAAQAAAPAAPAVSAPAPATQTTAQKVSEQSDEDFLKGLGL